MHGPKSVKLFCNMELAALLLLNMNKHLINEIPSYLTVVRRQYTRVDLAKRRLCKEPRHSVCGGTTVG